MKFIFDMQISIEVFYKLILWFSVCLYVCVCVCVCIYTLSPWRLLISARCLRHAWGVRINDLVLWVSFQVILPGFFIFISKNVIFNLQKQNTSLWYILLGEKMIYIYIYIYIYWYIYIDIGNKSPNQQTNKWRKDTKDKEATLI